MNHHISPPGFLRNIRPKMTGCFSPWTPSLSCRLLAIYCFLLAVIGVFAFPPAPHHTIQGIVRDKWGHPIQASKAIVILETVTGLQHKAVIVPQLAPGINYRLLVPLDAGLTQDNYQPTALRPCVSFRMKVLIGGVTYLPIETKANYASLGKPAQVTRLDLTLGEDLDGDGLPDEWENALARSLGGNLNTAEVKPGDDSDGDGLTNLQEYYAGTYAFDSQDGFRLNILSVSDGLPSLEFMAIRGRTYSIYGSADLAVWAPIRFRIVDAGSITPWLENYIAADTRILRIEAEVPKGRPMHVFKTLSQ